MPALPAKAAAGEFSMASWNVRGYHLGDNEIFNGANPADTNTVVGKIKQMGAEYIGFQEIAASQAIDIAERLGWGTGSANVRTAYEHLSGPAGFFEGIAMVSKYPMSEYKSVSLSPEGKGRKLQRAKIVKENRTYYVYNTHLGSNDWSSAEQSNTER